VPDPAQEPVTVSPPLRMGLCQLRMAWSGDEHLRGVLAALELAAGQGAQVCVFPELTLTGIHRQIASQARPERVEGWLQQVRLACARHHIAACVGAPTFGQALPPRDPHAPPEAVDATGSTGISDKHPPPTVIHISQHFVDAHGQRLGVVHKAGLTAPEATFFTPGHQRPLVQLAGRRWTAMICREIDDADMLAPLWLHERPDIVVWPGALRPDPALPRTEPPDHVQRAQRLARRCGVFIVMANWPNALNRPEESADAGRSVVIAPDGHIVLTLPGAQAGLAVFDLGQATFGWWPQAELAAFSPG
jgi:omega-amidase